MALTTPAQIDVWRAADSETEHLEFKAAKNQYDFDKLLAYCVALANERGGRLFLGIEDKPPRKVVGTNAWQNIPKVTAALLNKLKFRVDVEEVQHPDGRVLIFNVPSRPIGHPRELDGAYYMRSGESLVPMTADQLKKIFAEGSGSPPSTNRRKRTIYLLASAGVLAAILSTSLNPKLWRSNKVGFPRQNDPTAGRADPGPGREKPSPTLPPAIGAPGKTKGIGRVDWLDKQNWRTRLRVGMHRAEVRQLFGEPERVAVSSDLELWDYGSGEITFASGELYSWIEPTDPQPAGTSPRSLVQAPYGNLAARCQSLGASIRRFVSERNRMKPDVANHRDEFWAWYRLNDGRFRFAFYDESKALLNDLAAVNVKNRRLDELIEKHERYFFERNHQQSAQTVRDNSAMFHLSIEEIDEIGEGFESLATQVPMQ